MAVMLYNKRALSRAKLEAPYEIWKKNPADWTWDKVWEMCEDFRTAMGNKDGYYGITFGVEDGYPRSFGAAFFRYDPSQGKFISLMKKSETAKRYEILVDAVNNQLSTSVWDSVGFEQVRSSSTGDTAVLLRRTIPLCCDEKIGNLRVCAHSYRLDGATPV